MSRELENKLIEIDQKITSIETEKNLVVIRKIIDKKRGDIVHICQEITIEKNKDPIIKDLDVWENFK